MRNRLLFILFAMLIGSLSIVLPAGAQGGVTVTCDNGPDITNGVEIVVNQMRTGFTYTATAI
ncbi:MAG: hypothetical protein D6737_01305, partial [Chloroflexi bacterium]